MAMSEYENKGIAVEHKDLFDLADRIIEKSIPILIGKEVDTTLKEVTLYHFVRSLRLVRSVKILCMAGCATEANVLLRSLLNLTINIGWIVNKEVDKRVQRFVEFEPVKKYLNGEKLKTFGSIPEEEKRKYSNFHKKDCEDFMKKYHIENIGVLNTRGWSGKSISEMAKEIGAISDYQILYNMLSDLEHTGPHSASQFLERTETTRTMRLEPSEEGIANSLLTSLHYYIKVLEISLHIFDLEIGKIKNEIEDHYKLFKKHVEKTVPG